MILLNPIDSPVELSRLALGGEHIVPKEIDDTGLCANYRLALLISDRFTIIQKTTMASSYCTYSSDQADYNHAKVVRLLSCPRRLLSG